LQRGWKVALVPTEDPEPLEVVRWLFTQYAELETSICSLCKQLNQRGIPGPGSGTKRFPQRTCWTAGEVRRLLTNPHYVGDLRYGAESRGSYHRIIGGKVQEVEGTPATQYNGQAPVRRESHPGIIDRDTWDRVQAKLQSRKLKRCKPRAGGFVLSGGLLY